MSGVTVTTREQILDTSLTFSSTGVPTILYPRGMGATVPGLFRADNSSGSFVSTALVSNSNANLTNNGASVAAVNHATSGWNVSALRNGLGHLISAYIGPNNWLYATSCGD